MLLSLKRNLNCWFCMNIMISLSIYSLMGFECKYGGDVCIVIGNRAETVMERNNIFSFATTFIESIALKSNGKSRFGIVNGFISQNLTNNLSSSVSFIKNGEKKKLIGKNSFIFDGVQKCIKMLNTNGRENQMLLLLANSDMRYNLTLKTQIKMINNAAIKTMNVFLSEKMNFSQRIFLDDLMKFNMNNNKSIESIKYRVNGKKTEKENLIRDEIIENVMGFFCLNSNGSFLKTTKRRLGDFTSTSVDKGRYTFVIRSIGLTWHEAKSECERGNAMLATPLNEDEIVTLRAYATEFDTRFWIGGFQARNNFPPDGVDDTESVSPNSNWYWVHGVKIGTFDWAAIEPNDAFDGEGALHLFKSGDWNDLKSTKTVVKGFVCENRHDKYTIFHEKVTWLEAFDECSSRKMMLAMPKTIEEMDLMTTLITGLKLSQFWLGGYQGTSPQEVDDTNAHPPASNWHWIDGERIDLFNWWNIDPNDQSFGEGALTIFSTSNEKNGRWNDLKSTFTAGFICEPRFVLEKYTIFHDSAITWDEAVSKCQDANLQLAQASSSDDILFLSSIVSGLNSGNKYWIGGYYSVEFEKWLWRDDTEISVSNWRNEPVAIENGAIIVNTRIGTWSGVDKNILSRPRKFAGFICESTNN